MLLDTDEPISESCARTADTAVAALLQLGWMQPELVERVSDARRIVRAVLDEGQPIPRRELLMRARTLWTQLPRIPDLTTETVQRMRSIILACVEDIRRLAEGNSRVGESATAVTPAPVAAGSQPDESHVGADTIAPLATNGHAPVARSGGAKGLFDFMVPSGAPPAGLQRWQDEPRRARTERATPPRRQPTLFDVIGRGLADTRSAASPAVDNGAAEVTAAANGDKESELVAVDAGSGSVGECRTFTFASGEKAKAQDVLAAIRTLKKIDDEQRPATPEERETLVRFAGFGPVALSIFPNPATGRYKDASWQELGEELKTLLTPEEYDSAKRTTFNAYYTSPTVIATMHAAMQRLGVARDGTVLEPACGTGNFLRLAPPGMRCIGIELDSISGRIAKALHPAHDIRIENFRDTRLPENSLDAVIGNVPFADVKLEHRGQKFSLHDYFFAKSVDALKPSGVLGLVTSHFTLDKQNAALREYLAATADFVGAIRLPADAFKREGTAVVTDIVFLRKRAAGEQPAHVDPAWLGVAPLRIESVEVAINRYFHSHPEMVLGTWTVKDTLYGEGYSVVGNGDLAQQLQDVIRRLPEYAPRPAASVREKPAAAFARPPPERPLGEGSFFVDEDGTICQVLNAVSVPVVYAGTTLHARGTQTGKRLALLIRLRDLARTVLQSQNEGWPEKERTDARRELNWAYDRFAALYGPINKVSLSATASGQTIRRMPNVVKFREDPDAMLVMSLEEYSEATGKATKAAILLKDVVGRKPPATSVTSAEEGLLVSLDQKGSVDLAFIAALYGKSEEHILSELGDLVFQEPEQRRWETADIYLSGNVRAKLAAVLNAGPSYARNAEALREIQPPDILPGDIDATLGAPWIPGSDVQAFAAELFHVAASSIQVGRVQKDAVWSIDADYAAERSVAATSEYGTARANGVWLLELALNMKTPVIYDTIMDGGREERVVNQEATLAAREKQKQIKERFRAWLFTDPDRTERLVRVYNDAFNNMRARAFDGSHLEFSGMNQTIDLRQHQKDAVWRTMSSGNTLLAQVVGAGKTYIMAAAGMKMKQAGLIQKPLYVVPNHMLEQFGREFLQLYPNAKLLIAGKEDLARDRRKYLTAKIASGTWDGIVVTHSSFERIGMSRAYQEQFLTQQIQEYEALLCDGAGRDATRAQRNLIKTIEKQKLRREEKLKELLAEGKKDDGLVFDELGIDYLFIDEAQYFKNLETPTKMERVAGIQSGGSERAFDLYMKARYLHGRHPGHGVTFATGTPISNSMMELYTMMRYLDPEGLRGRGIEHFDAWAATFGEIVDTMEISPDGARLRPRSRFARFTNLPELQQLFRSFAEVQTADMLDLPRPRLEGGKAAVVPCPMSEEQDALQQRLVERYDRIRSQKVDPREDNALAITTDGRKLALDARLLSASAVDYPGSKVNALVENVAAIWQRTVATRATQLVFCDLGVHPTAWGFSVYDDIIGKLRARGIPAAEIATIGDADTDAKKQALFAKVRNGQVRVLLGSTQKMGMGTNVQKRLVALHHLDAPWKPAEVEQREGRILRQGNDNPEVSIHRYVTERSFDSFIWQALETKAKFIAQVMNGTNTVRRAEDIGGHEFSYAEVKAIASGNPAILSLAEADAELQRLAILQKNHADEQYLARRSVRDLPRTIAFLAERLAGLQEDAERLAARAADGVAVGEGIGGDVMTALTDRLALLPKWITEERRVPLGTCRGLRFGLVLHPQGTPDVYLEGAAMRQSMLSREHHGPRAILNALDRLADGYKAECARLQQELAVVQAQLRDYESRVGAPFGHEAYLSQLTAVRDELRAVLSGTTDTGNGDGAKSTSELAATIRSLTGAHGVAVAPERIGSRHGPAAEPVTARIRRRLGSVFYRNSADAGS